MASAAEIEGAKALWRQFHDPVNFPTGNPPQWEYQTDFTKASYLRNAKAVLEAAEAVRPAVDRAAVEAAMWQVERSSGRLAVAVESRTFASYIQSYREDLKKDEAALLALIAPETGAPKE